MQKQLIRFIANGEEYEVLVKPNATLLDVLRDQCQLTGAKQGCGTGNCGACTVLLDGRSVNSCLVLAMKARGKSILTIEGMASGTELHPIQQAFIEHGAVQCGFCTPGMILSAKALLDRNPNPTREEIKTAIAGNLCRCTGYIKIIDAIEAATKKTKQVVTHSR
jgi:carbon-monoxide dehydrogenase small subunit